MPGVPPVGGAVICSPHGSAAALVLLWAALVLKDAADPSDLPFLR